MIRSATNYWGCILSLGCLAVAVNGDNGELSCKQCNDVTFDLCILASGKNPGRCEVYAKDNISCRLSCNQCPRAMEYFCSFATPDSKGKCKSYGDQVCKRAIKEGQLPCSRCKVPRRLCKYAPPRSQLQKKCLGQAKRYCDILCKDCKGMAEIYCRYPPNAPNFDTCMVDGELLCLNTIDWTANDLTWTKLNWPELTCWMDSAKKKLLVNQTFLSNVIVIFYYSFEIF